MNAYPPAAEVVDAHLSQSLEGMRASMEKGFDRVERRIDEMATKEAVNAHIKRLDERDNSIENKVDNGFREVRDEMKAGFTSIEKRDIERDRAALAKDEIRDKNVKQRVTWLIAGAGIVLTAVQLIIRFAFPESG